MNNAINTEALVQSGRGGKIHFSCCGQRSRRARTLYETVNKTYEELVQKYGDHLCQYCFNDWLEEQQA